MALKIFYKSVTDEFAKGMQGFYRPMATAGKNAVQEMAETIKKEGRADIAAAGFSQRWQNTFRVDVYPTGKQVSINSAALIYHKIPYADVFETGATIRGKGKLWIPLKTTPKKIGRKKMTAKLYDDEIGGLFSLKIGGKPYLAAKISVSKAMAKKKTHGKVTLSRLRKGRGAELTRTVPLFVGVDSVKIRDRFSIRQITDRAAARLGDLYIKHMGDEVI